MIKLKGAWSYRRAIKKEKFNSAIKAQLHKQKIRNLMKFLHHFNSCFS